MIACPKCGADTTVLETRVAPEYARRRRLCKVASCGTKVTTLEAVVDNPRYRPGGKVVMVRRSDLDKLLEIVARMDRGGVD